MHLPRFMITGTGSGSGKTTITCAVIKALIDKGQSVAAFKSGPDYIDPMFHAKVLGASSANLDLFLCSEDEVLRSLARNAMSSDISIIEGAMGMYDGLGATSSIASANHLALLTNTPQILVINTKGMSVSLLAIIEGYKNFAENKLVGVILNNTNTHMYPIYKDMIENHFDDIKVYGYLPPLKEAQLGSRHLGLLIPQEIEDLNEKVALLADNAKKSIDLDAIIALAQGAPTYNYPELPMPLPIFPSHIKIALAHDEAFCFYYSDAINMLKSLGAEIVYFSPLRDKTLPKDANALILGGGYPEEYLSELSKNTQILGAIKQAIESGMPTIAECGGFMYLHESVTDKSGTAYPLVGIIKGNSFMTEKMVRFGYKKLTAKSDNLLLDAGESVNCHEFHYSDSTCNGSDFIAEKNGKTFECIHASETLFAGYPHLHLCSNHGMGIKFMRAALKYHEQSLVK